MLTYQILFLIWEAGVKKLVKKVRVVEGLHDVQEDDENVKVMWALEVLMPNVPLSGSYLQDFE